MRIAVTTPTGNVGQHVVPLLIRAGIRPTVLVRDPARLDPALRDWVDAVAVDQGDDDAVLAATAGVDALYWVNPSNFADDPVAEYARVGGIAARAITENNISRVVFQSSVGAEKRHCAGGVLQPCLESVPIAVRKVPGGSSCDRSRNTNRWLWASYSAFSEC